MNNMEEKLWSYIDGSCTADEQIAIAQLIQSDPLYKSKYLELLELDRQFAALELDEPPMAFAYNVMETIRAEQALKPLKAKINYRLMNSILFFFMAIIAVLLLFVLVNVNWRAGNSDIVTAFKLPNLTNYLNNPFMRGFFYFDVVLGMYFTDRYLRGRSHKNRQTVQNSV